jgi:hypothetical protein
MTDIEIAERVYDVFRRNASSNASVGEVINQMLSFKTSDKTFQNVAILLAMIHANTEGH